MFPYMQSSPGRRRGVRSGNRWRGYRPIPYSRRSYHELESLASSVVMLDGNEPLSISGTQPRLPYYGVEILLPLALARSIVYETNPRRAR
jgi:hypothetical protein